MATRLRALILEDNPFDLELIVHELRRAGFDPDFQHADNQADYVAFLDASLDVILADYSLPQFDATQALSILQQHDLDIPFIVVTSSVSEEAAVEAMKLGAADYLIKDRLTRLGPAVEQALEAKRLRAERRRTQQEIRRRNRELTLLNRVISASAEGLDEQGVLQVACQELATALGLLHTVAVMINRDWRAATVVGEHCADGCPAILGQSIPLVEGITEDELMALSPLSVDERTDDPRLGMIRSLVADSRLSSMVFFPLLVDGDVSGGLGLGLDRDRRLVQEDHDLVQSVADQLSGVLSRAHLAQEHRRWMTAIAQTADSVIVTDSQGVILDVNAGFEVTTGYSRDEAVGQNVSMLESVPGQGLDRDRASVAETAEPDWRGRVVNCKKDGVLYTVDVSITPIKDESGQTTSYVHVQRDVTHELELEQRYMQAQKMEAVGRLAGGIAHDFNNLLTAITGYTDLLLDDAAQDDPNSEDLYEISRAARRAATLTHQLLAFSRKQVMQPKLLDLNVLVRDVRRMLGRLIGEDIVLETELARDLGKVRADPGQLEQVVMNLAVNARDAMPDGGQLEIRTADVELGADFCREHPGSTPGPYVLLSVTDTGTGMDENVLSHLFEPFFSTKEPGKGTGLGLATAYGIVKQSNGFIAVSSQLGEGSTFEVYLPRASGKSQSLEARRDAAPSALGMETVLLVEDDNMVRGLSARVLTRQGYTVLVADHPDVAMRIAKEHQSSIHLLISDVVMPGMSGRDLADLILTEHPEMAVLYMSGYTDDAIVHRGVLDPGLAFLSKPFTPAELAHKVREVLDGLAM